ncbi:MAG: hypothetical protein ACXAC7_21985 [Candidatus Hodarchaeales archaeon]|jgi:hypothetical protein
MELFGFKHLIQTENETISQTQYELHGYYEKFPELIDAFLNLPYFTGTFKPLNIPEGVLQAFCYTQYAQDPLTFWSMYKLYEKGSYLEANILLRHLFESFIQLRYFAKHPEKTENHMSGKQRVNFSVMFNEFAPGYYKTFYGKLFSEFAHGMIGKDMFRFKRKSPTDSEWIKGCVYNEFWASGIVNNTIWLLLGYFRNFIKIYPDNTIRNNQDYQEKYDRTKNWLLIAVEEHKKNHPKSKDWQGLMDKIISD